MTVGAAVSPWTNTDVGSVTFPGSATEQNGLGAINGSGTSINGSSDSFFLRSRHLTGDGEIRVRVRYIPSFSSARVGVMLRESTAAGSPMTALTLAPFFNNADIFNYRTTANAAASSVDFGIGIAASSWVRVVRSGNNFSAYDSPDGATWTQRGATQAITMANDILAGIGVDAASNLKLNTALVDSVQIIGTPNNTAPSIDAGPDGSVQFNTACALAGTLNDDALPSTPGTSSVQWSKTSGPGTAAFADATAVNTTAIFSSAGTYVLRLTADDGEVRTFDEATITVLTPIEAWRQQQFGANANDPAISGDNADPNHNGLANLLEYAFALDPNATTASGQPAVARTAGEVSLTFTRRSAAPDIMLTVEWSDDLTPLSWSTAGVSYQVTPIDAAHEMVKAAVATDGAVPQRVLRVKVTRP